MSALKYWIWLAGTRHIGAAGINRLLYSFGSPEEVYTAPEESLKAAVGLSDGALAELADKSFDRAERVLDACESLNISVLSIQDSLYPARLKEIENPPAVLYVKGKLPFFDEEPAIGIVGSRKTTPYGSFAARELAYSLAKAGMLVVSGMAKGIDGIAHTGALQAGAKTVAVLGCGPDIAYPAENRELYEDIVSSGAVVSEYPPGTPVLGANFPARNRIISGLSLGTLVIEAPVHSGALITASFAMSQGRDIFAVPANIDQPESEGCNELIKEGARLVTRADDILSEYLPLFGAKLKMQSPRKSPPPMPIQKEQKQTAEVPTKPKDISKIIEGRSELSQKLILYMATDPKHIDDLITHTQAPASAVLSELTMLEIDETIKQLPGKRFALE